MYSQREVEEAARAVEVEKSQTVDVLQQNHESHMLQLRQEHTEAMKILRKQVYEPMRPVLFVRCRCMNVLDFFVLKPQIMYAEILLRIK